MKRHASRARSSLGLAGFLLVLVTALGAQAEPPPTRLPGRKPDSTEPWGAFLGRSAHVAIGNQYRLQHPTNTVFLDVDLSTVMEDGELGNPERLSPFVKRLRPDITDTRAFVLFEIKPDNDGASRQAREQVERYLTALNAAVEPPKKLVGGIGFEGSIFLEFEDGGALWQLSWRTPEAGVTLYRWSYRRKKPHSSWKERADQKEEALPREEMDAHGEMAEQVIRAAYEEGTFPSGFRGQVYLPVDCR